MKAGIPANAGKLTSLLVYGSTFNSQQHVHTKTKSANPPDFIYSFTSSYICLQQCYQNTAYLWFSHIFSLVLGIYSRSLKPIFLILFNHLMVISLAGPSKVRVTNVNALSCIPTKEQYICTLNLVPTTSLLISQF